VILLDPYALEHLVLFEPDEADAWRAAELRARLYDRNDRSLSLADCFLLAHASEDGAVATSDPPVAEVARSEGIAVVALPDSSGRPLGCATSCRGSGPSWSSGSNLTRVYDKLGVRSRAEFALRFAAAEVTRTRS
jgi:hypothetical protein